MKEYGNSEGLYKGVSFLLNSRIDRTGVTPTKEMIRVEAETLKEDTAHRHVVNAEFYEDEDKFHDEFGEEDKEDEEKEDDDDAAAATDQEDV
ncbi:uncharacterized protein A4U43_C04F10430 [Asparagus officinalis]|uniref:Uncharacterized protein n=1 Tax=Asparagus officinalis TaxID=4686 RepID=A0A5P1F2H9_ASPOF|nr:uncharacterized protein A4U43_C04F10430 [Asparagus officinalis]